MNTPKPKVHYTLCVLFLLTVSSVLLHKGLGDVCSKGLGKCGPQCKSRCKAKHPGGKASCDSTTRTCKCFYECGTPAPPPGKGGKTCTLGAGMCSASCDDKCCEKLCRGRYVGKSKLHGFCYRPIGLYFDFCYCNFKC